MLLELLELYPESCGVACLPTCIVVLVAAVPLLAVESSDLLLSSELCRWNDDEVVECFVADEEQVDEEREECSEQWPPRCTSGVQPEPEHEDEDDIDDEDDDDEEQAIYQSSRTINK